LEEPRRRQHHAREAAADKFPVRERWRTNVLPLYYRGRDMRLSHGGMGISESDWSIFLSHAAATLAKFKVPEAEQRDVVAFVQSLKKDIVE